MFAPDYYCDSNQQPIVRIACNRHPCPTWNTGDWSEVLKYLLLYKINIYMNTISCIEYIKHNRKLYDMFFYMNIYYKNKNI